MARVFSTGVRVGDLSTVPDGVSSVEQLAARKRMPGMSVARYRGVVTDVFGCIGELDEPVFRS